MLFGGAQAIGAAEISLDAIDQLGRSPIRRRASIKIVERQEPRLAALRRHTVLASRLYRPAIRPQFLSPLFRPQVCVSVATTLPNQNRWQRKCR
jgi:hypothetical protein